MLGTSTLIGSTADGAHDGVSGGGEAAQPNTNTNTNTNTNSSIMIGGEDEKAVSQSSGGGGVGGGSAGGDLFESDRSTGGNRWPRQETLALLKIRSDMDVVFRDSSLKGPLWEEVSRKMAELGYHRSAKKCKEKFENVYKYHKRTKDGRVGKSDGKTYRFFDQLEALEQHQMAIAASQALPPLPQSTAAQVTPRVVQSQGAAQAAVPVTMVIPAGTNPASVTVPSSPHPISVVHTTCSISTHPQQPPQVNVSNPTMNQVPPHLQSSHQVLPQQQQHHHHHHQQQAMGSIPSHSSIQMENPSSPSATQSSSSTSSDEELIGRSRKRKRKWKDFFEKLMKDVIEKQEELQKRFLEAVEKREHDRIAREEAWKTQEMSRLNREHEILVQERSMASAKDAALIAFLQKLSDQQQIPLSLPAQVQVQAQAPAQAQPQAPGQAQPQDHAAAPVVASVVTPTQPQPPAPPPQLQQQVLLQPQSQPQPQPQTQIIVTESQVSSLPSPTPSLPKSQPLTQVPQQQPQQMSQALVVANTNNGDNGDFQKTSSGDNLLQASSSRWPKAEVQALINLRTNLDQKYQENGPKGPLWEEISGAMRKLGYNRNAKRCKEKWENINKYFKKVKESNKKRPEDSKTCPYFHQLDALYRERNKMEISGAPTTVIPAFGQQQHQMKHEGATMAPMMVQPEQQWPHPNQAMDDQGSENQDDSDDDVDDDDDDDHGSGYEIVANNNNNNVNAGSMSTTTAATRTATTE